MTDQNFVVPMGPWDANQAALAEWHDDEAIGADEAEILASLATVGTYAASNALWNKGFRAGKLTILTVLEAAFQLGRSVGQREVTHEIE